MKKTVLALALLLTLMVSAGICEEMPHLIWWLPCAGDAPIDWPKVEAQMNAYSAEKIGVTCEYRFLTSDQMSLAMETGEPFDIAFTSDWCNDFATNVSRGMFLDLTDELENFPALSSSVLDMAWDGAKYKGRIYAIPTMKDIGIEVFWIIDTEYFHNQKGMPKDANIDFDGIEPYLEMYKADYPEKYPLTLDYEGIMSWESGVVDWISLEYLIGLDWDEQGTADGLTVKSALDIPAFSHRLEVIHSWYEKGYINPDAAVTDLLYRREQGIIQSGMGYYGCDTLWSELCRRPTYIVRYDGPFMSTSSLRGSMTAISSTTKYPEAALKLVELMDTDAHYRELAGYGIEGVHFTRNDDGTITITDRESMNLWNICQGHVTLLPIEESGFPEIPADPNMWDVVFDGYKDAKMSLAMGFTFDVSPVENECLAIAAIAGEYWRELITGTSDPAEVLPEMRGRMERAGLSAVLEEAQSQLDAFIDEQSSKN